MAVSLLLLITLALAVFVASMFVGLGQITEQEPRRASLSVSGDERTDNITITHGGGDGLADDRTRIVLRNESSDQRMTFQPGSSGEVFSAGETIVIDVDDGAIGPASSGFSTRPAVTPMSGLSSGTRYTVQLIDTRNNRVIFQTALTV